jgi:hypothetical protein
MSDEQKKTAFDIVRAGFYLIAAILAFHMLIVFLLTLSCTYATLWDLPASEKCQDLKALLSDILTGGLASALAFVGGRSVPKE